MKKPFAVTLDIASSLANHTGSWRASRPVYVDRLPPCNSTCPAGETFNSGSTLRSKQTTAAPG